MSAIPKTEWGSVGELYKSGQPMRLVAKHFGVSINAVVYVLRKTSIPRRTFIEASRLKFEAKPSSFTIKDTHNSELEAIGMALYWAEGHKSSTAAGIDFANSDPSMTELFVRFLRDRYILDAQRLRAFIYCYEDQNIDAIIDFWSQKLGIPKTQFTRPHIRKNPRPNDRVMPYGLIHVRYSDKKMLQDVLNLIESYRTTHCVGGRVVNYTTL